MRDGFRLALAVAYGLAALTMYFGCLALVASSSVVLAESGMVTTPMHVIVGIAYWGGLFVLAFVLIQIARRVVSPDRPFWIVFAIIVIGAAVVIALLGGFVVIVRVWEAHQLGGFL